MTAPTSPQRAALPLTILCCLIAGLGALDLFRSLSFEYPVLRDAQRAAHAALPVIPAPLGARSEEPGPDQPFHGAGDGSESRDSGSGPAEENPSPVPAPSSSRTSSATNDDESAQRARDEAQARAHAQLCDDRLGRYKVMLGAEGALIAALPFIGFFGPRRIRTVRAATSASQLILSTCGIVILACRLLLQGALPDFVAWGLAYVVVLNLAGAFILPWSTREAAVPAGVTLAVWAISFLAPGAGALSVVDRLVGVLVSPLALAPGLFIVAFGERRRRDDDERRRLGAQVQHIGGELSRARIVHDAMFPREFGGPIDFVYDYQPIAEIGGDYVHVRRCPRTDSVTLTLLDVAGHGLAAALTVNRLFGELERILAENIDAEPAEVMTLLNRYIHLTMAPHSMFATGTCMRLDAPTGELKWVSAGHPPSLLRHANGRVQELPTTTLLLGAMEPGLFDPDQQSVILAPGDTVIAYTDGAFEARNPDGRRFGLAGVRSVAGFTPPPRHWPRFIAGAVAEHHRGGADDDVLIAAIHLNHLRVAVSSRPQATGNAETGAARPQTAG